MLDAVVGNFIDSVSEREFDAPFMALLRAEGFFDIHFTHGMYEFGKDFIAKKREDGVEWQYVFQSKAGNLNLGDWTSGLGQIELLRNNQLAHPNFGSLLPRRAVFVTTGRFTGGALLAAQDYCAQSATTGTPLTTWDRERLIELTIGAITIGLADRVEADLLSTVGAARQNKLTDRQIEQFARRWCVDGQNPSACVMEAAVVASALEHTGRADLSSYTGLTLVRAACWQIHESEPVDRDWNAARRLGRHIFSTYADGLFGRLVSNGMPATTNLIRAHREASAVITHTVRCVRVVELIGLLGLLDEEDRFGRSSRDIAQALSRFLQHQTSTASPLSDRWAVAIVPVALLLMREGMADKARDYLREVGIWLMQRYGRGTGLAAATASPEAEVRQAIGQVIPHAPVPRRDDSYLAGVLLELLAFLRFDRLYAFIRDECARLNVRVLVVHTDDCQGQYMLDGPGVEHEVNVNYADSLPDNWTNAAPHLTNAASARYLQRARARARGAHGTTWLPAQSCEIDTSLVLGHP